MESLRIGSRVRVTRKHWLRAGAIGVIVGFDAERESSRWAVAFDRQCLRLQDGQLEQIII